MFRFHIVACFHPTSDREQNEDLGDGDDSQIHKKNASLVRNL